MTNHHSAGHRRAAALAFGHYVWPHRWTLLGMACAVVLAWCALRLIPDVEDQPYHNSNWPTPEAMCEVFPSYCTPTTASF